MIKFNKRYYGVEFDIELKDKICLFDGYSGTGKSFAMMAIHKYLVEQGVDVLYINYENCNYTVEQMIGLCSVNKVIIMDDADLYMTQELYNYIKLNCEQSLICLKDIYRIRRGNCGFYSIIYEGDTLRTKKDNIGIIT